jgi:hypothetical protein
MTKTHADKCASLNSPNIAAGQAIYKDCDCDGYHTFNELYDHRITLYIALCKKLQAWVYLPGERNERSDGYDKCVWRSKRHSDGELCFGTGTQYVLGIGREAGKQITYHIPIERWDESGFAETLEVAPEWDGHTSADVLDRLKAL